MRILGRVADNIPYDEYKLVLDSNGLPSLIGGEWIHESGGITLSREVFDSRTAEEEGYAGKERQVYMIARSSETGAEYVVSCAAMQATMKVLGHQTIIQFLASQLGLVKK